MAEEIISIFQKEQDMEVFWLIRGEWEMEICQNEMNGLFAVSQFPIH